MDTQTPPTLEELARQVLLKNEALTISALEQLPKMIFLDLFQEALRQRLPNIVRAMMAAWPSLYIPMGVLKISTNWEVSSAMDKGLWDLLTQKDHPVRGNPLILDFRDVSHEFWTLKVRTEDGAGSAETVSEKQTVKAPPRYEPRQRVKLITDLYSRFQQDLEGTDFLPGVLHTKESLRMCCVNMKIVYLCDGSTERIFRGDHINIFQGIRTLHCIEVLELTIDTSFSNILRFYRYFSSMKNLHTLSLVLMDKNTSGFYIFSEFKGLIHSLISEFSNFRSLQHLCMNGICFLSDHLRHLLRSLKNRLETFSVTHCQLTRANFYQLSQCQLLYHLKHLDMSGVLLSNFCMMPLRVLLERVADTLETLELEGCGIKDSQLSFFLPALSQCSKLTKVNFYTNDFSMNVLSDLLHHTANLSKMTMEQYPAPRECYELGVVSIERFVQVCPVLMDTLGAVRQPKSISFATDVCSRCSKRCVYEQETRLCPCLQ